MPASSPATRQSLTTTRTRLRFSDRANGVLGRRSRWEATRSAGKFPDYKSALEAYHSDEYQEIKKLRNNTAILDLVIVEGFDPSAPH